MLKPRLRSGINWNIICLFGLLVAMMFVVASGYQAGAISRQAPDESSAGGYGGSSPRFAIENKPHIKTTRISVPVYLPTRPTSNVTVEVIGFRYPWGHEQNKSGLIGVKFNGGATRRENHTFQIAPSRFSYDNLTGRWRTDIVITGHGGPTTGQYSYRNTAQFSLRLPSHYNALIGIAGKQNYSILSANYHTYDYDNYVYNYAIPFATPCNITKNTVNTIQLRDLDSRHVDNGYHSISVSVRDLTTGSNVPISTSGGTGNGEVYQIRMTFQPGHRYQLRVNRVHANNSLDFTFPYDNINYSVQCSWSLSENDAYIQKYDSADNLTGSPLGKSVDALPGERYGFFYRWVNNGPTPTDKSVSIMRNFTYPTASSGGWEVMQTKPSGVGVYDSGARASDRIYLMNGSAGHTSRIPESAVGSKYCIQTGVKPRSSSNSNQLNGSQLCVNVPHRFTLTPGVEVTSGEVTEPGASISVRSTVRNHGPTKSIDNTIWRVIGFRLARGNPEPSGGTTSNSPCQYLSTQPGVNYGASNCWQVGAQQTGSLAASSTPHMVNRSEHTPSDLSVGDKLCYMTWVNPPSHSSGGWAYSGADCTIVGKRPKLQVHGGDVITPENIKTSVTAKSDGDYGSWGEYGLLAGGDVMGMASAAALTDKNSTETERKRLTFANTELIAGHYNSRLISSTPPIVAKFKSLPVSWTSRSGNLNLSSLSAGKNYIRSSSLNLTGGQLGSGRAAIIDAVGSRVRISGDLRYEDAEYNSIDQLPQLVIMANEIDISCGVEWIEAWLITPVAGGKINTCHERGDTGNMAADVAGDKQLEINGPVLTDKLYLRRTFGSDGGGDSAVPAEIINLRADAYLWAYAQAGGSGRAQTVLTTEVPPRF